MRKSTMRRMKLIAKTELLLAEAKKSLKTADKPESIASLEAVVKTCQAFLVWIREDDLPVPPRKKPAKKTKKKVAKKTAKKTKKKAA